MIAAAARIGLRAAGIVESRATQVGRRVLALPPVLRWFVTIAFFFVALVARRPETLLRPEFVFEDGSLWYLGAWQLQPLDGILTSYAGYLHLIPRTVGYLERLVPTALAPLLGNLISLLLVALVAAFISSDRLAGVIPSRRLRFLLALYLVLLPTTYMTLGSITFVQFYFCLFLVAAAFSELPRRRVAAAGTYLAVAAAAATGPFGLLLTPLFIGRLLVRKDRASLLMLVAVGLPTIAQAFTLLGAGRPDAAPPTTDPLAIVQIIAGHGAVALLGGRPISWLLEAGVPRLLIELAGAAALGLAVLHLRRLPIRWLLVIGYVMAAIGVPALLAGSDNTALLLDPLSASRYLMVITAMLGGGLLLALEGRPLTFVSALAGAMLLFGVVGDARLKAYPDYHWPQASACIGGPVACVVPVFAGGTFDIRWPGSGAAP